MKKKLIMMLMLIGIVTITACGGNSNEGLTAADVAGTWEEQERSDGEKTLILREDMTYTETIKVMSPMLIQTTTDDTYSLDGDTIELNYSDYGTSSEYKVTLTEDTMTLDNGSSQMVFKKK